MTAALVRDRYHRLHAAENPFAFFNTLVRFWYTRGHFAEGRSWAERTLAAGPTSDAVRAKALAAAGWLASEQGDDRLAIEFQEAGLTLARKAGDLAWIAQALTSLGLALEDQGRLAEAQALHEEALRGYRALDDTLWPPFALNALGLVAYEQRDFDRAATRFEEALAEFQEHGNRYGAAFALTNLAKVARAQGDYPRANALFGEGLALWADYGDRRGIAGCLRGLASIAAMTGRLGQAARLGGAAEALYEAVGASGRPHPARYEHAVAAVRARLGNAAFDAAWAEGRALSLMEAVSEAMTSNLASAPAASVADEHLSTESCGLTPRELDVLRLLVEGHRDHEIAGALFLSRRTIQTHVTHLFTKLGVNTRAEAAAFAVRRGLV